ncbi:glycerophosphoryl diester phosphodiesterase membrane domain-containing protein [Microbacterium sp. AZCO]|uniref:glycerophosphoryl diester phosphodiesterase membrane domain-containing protein n=1 Tax=Microbacterium sp. AZCO TaxID=3142976 RepID=UPI0031F46860
MTAYPAWTPASRPGVIPLRPLTFGTILGRSFTALRQNPRVLLGFALCVQAIAYVVVIVAVGAVGWASFSRLETLQYGTDDYDAVMAGSIALTAVVGVVLGLAAGALGVIVQGVVVTEVAHAAVAEKLTLGALWRQVKPVVWRLIGYALLLLGATIAAFAVVGLGIFALALVAAPAAAALGVLLVVAALPVILWLSVKLLLTPSAIILERARVGTAIARSWRLTRGRFWPALGILVLINLIFGGIAQVVSIPFSFLGAGLSTILAPTGDATATQIISIISTSLLAQAVTLLIQAVATVVQSTAAALIYIDCRMRHEGLDLDLLAYVERRDAGAQGLPDPYLEGVGRAIGPRWAAPVYGPAGYAPAGYAPAGYPQFGGRGAYLGQGYPGQAYPAQGYPTQDYPGQGYPTQGYPAQGYPTQGYPAGYGQQQPYPQAPVSPYAQPVHPQPPAHVPTPQYAQPVHPQGQPSYPPRAPAYPADPQVQPGHLPSQQPQPTADADPAPAMPAPEPTRWAAPGEPADGSDRESPWR